jgi:hypothetical protein
VRALTALTFAAVLSAMLRWQWVWFAGTSEPRPRALQLPAETGGIELGSAAFIEHAHSLGLFVHYWVVNTAPKMRELLEAGADGIITDRFDRGVDVFREMGACAGVTRALASLTTFAAGLPLEDAPALCETAAAQRFVPTFEHTEVHTCVSVVCRVIHAVSLSPRTALLGIVVLAAVVAQRVMRARALLRRYTGGRSGKRPKAD